MAVYQLTSSKTGTLRWRRNFSAPCSACARVATTRRLPCPWPLIRSMNASGSLPLAAVSTRSPVVVRRICAFSSSESALGNASCAISPDIDGSCCATNISSPGRAGTATRTRAASHRHAMHSVFALCRGEVQAEHTFLRTAKIVCSRDAFLRFKLYTSWSDGWEGFSSYEIPSTSFNAFFMLSD